MRWGHRALTVAPRRELMFNIFSKQGIKPRKRRHLCSPTREGGVTLGLCKEPRSGGIDLRTDVHFNSRTDGPEGG